MLGRKPLDTLKLFLMSAYPYWWRVLGHPLLYSTALGESSHAELKASMNFASKRFNLARGGGGPASLAPSNRPGIPVPSGLASPGARRRALPAPQVA